MIFVLMIGAMIVLTGCATKTEYVYIQPECSVPPMVTDADLPDIDVAKVYNALGTKTAEKLLKRERLIVDCLLEHRAILEEVCGDGSD